MFNYFKLSCFLSFVFLIMASSTVVFAKTQADKNFIKAVLKENVKGAESALRAGAHVNLQEETESGDTALIIAVKDNNKNMVQLLLDHGANPNIKNDDGFTALFYIRDDNLDIALDIIKLLIEYGADLNVKGGVGLEITFLMSVGCNNQDDGIKIVQFLLDHGADVHAKDSSGCTALFYAVKEAWAEEDFELVKLLIEYGADVNVRCGKNLQTPLMCAYEIEIVQFLLDHGADVHAKDRFGKTALQRAKESKYVNDAIVQLLLAYGA